MFAIRKLLYKLNFELTSRKKLEASMLEMNIKVEKKENDMVVKKIDEEIIPIEEEKENDEDLNIQSSSVKIDWKDNRKLISRSADSMSFKSEKDLLLVLEVRH